MKISGVMPLRNAVKLGYPFELAIRSLRPLCDEVVVLVDPTSEDDTFARVRALGVDRIVESVWDMSNHRGHTNCEISVQTQKVCDAASGDWIFSLQADEVLHEAEIGNIRSAAEDADAGSVSAYSLCRIYFYGSLEQYRHDWTQHLVRLFKRGRWKPDVDGAMKFEPVDPAAETLGVMPNARGVRWDNYSHAPASSGACIYHYSRVGDPRVIAERVRNLDGFFHEPDRIKSGGEILAYDFSTMRKLDTYVIGTAAEIEPNARLVHFPLDGHPAGVRECFK